MLNISNYYEQLVIDRLWKLAEEAVEPFSQAFQEDVACLALNKLSPCYVRNSIDKSINIGEKQYQEMVEAVDLAITQGIETVQRRTHGDRE
ncbi:late competence development ComFB family protein [Methylomonas montana]|uniref:late competence development ComFB family protein n=1 Tax=Methylomonas montana TaxID=3058963 RepID=UPI002658D8A6|nr:late competence development ComFB family protein [Methylomonas montana]WKJ90812.1 late competence development ComFB family protein [Methylomonas montana]